jgi:hypothetical protein
MIPTRVSSDETFLSGANRVGQLTNVWQMCLATLKESNDEQRLGRTGLRSRGDRKGCVDQSSFKRSHPVLHQAAERLIRSSWCGIAVPVGDDRIKDRLRFAIRDDSVGIGPFSKGGATVISVRHFDDWTSKRSGSHNIASRHFGIV